MKRSVPISDDEVNSLLRRDLKDLHQQTCGCEEPDTGIGQFLADLLKEFASRSTTGVVTPEAFDTNVQALLTVGGGELLKAAKTFMDASSNPNPQSTTLFQEIAEVSLCSAALADKRQVLREVMRYLVSEMLELVRAVKVSSFDDTTVYHLVCAIKNNAELCEVFKDYKCLPSEEKFEAMKLANRTDISIQRILALLESEGPESEEFQENLDLMGEFLPTLSEEQKLSFMHEINTHAILTEWGNDPVNEWCNFPDISQFPKVLVKAHAKGILKHVWNVTCGQYLWHENYPDYWSSAMEAMVDMCPEEVTAFIEEFVLSSLAQEAEDTSPEDDMFQEEVADMAAMLGALSEMKGGSNLFKPCAREIQAMLEPLYEAILNQPGYARQVKALRDTLESIISGVEIDCSASSSSSSEHQSKRVRTHADDDNDDATGKEEDS